MSQQPHYVRGHATTATATATATAPAEQQSAELGLTWLADYRPPLYTVDDVHLTFGIEDAHTTVSSILHCRHNPKAGEMAPIVLDGGPPSDMKLLSVTLDRVPLQAGSDYKVDEASGRLHISKRPAQPAFTLEIATAIEPKKNTALEGLYQSNDVMLTQCEAEGFRRITYFFDRPDVLAKYTTTIVADKIKYPVLLSNGNLVAEGQTEGGKHWAKWEDPYPKPAYLFALVAGQLHYLEETYTTAASKRKVTLRIYTEEENVYKVGHAMASLRRAMKWDEDKYGLEYDLANMNIVAVNDFNMGAMENKGLNIFNSKYLVADSRTATDDDFMNIERVIGHEYFHNYTGNRVTLRDWFQLSLKEGLTVFRENQFMADHHSPAVQRINEVTTLRNSQFREDSGPMAHSVRPASYIDISNFYTTTIYEKGAEVVGMLHTLLGDDTFTRGVQTYLRENDGKAATVEDFVRAMETVSGRTLSQFYRWYDQAGTPEVKVAKESFDERARQYKLTLAQSPASTPGQPAESKRPFLIPVTVGLLGRDGQPIHSQLSDSDPELASHTLELSDVEQSFVFNNVASKPVLSVLRHFSAPVKLVHQQTKEDRLLLLRHDTDAFNRWESCQHLALDAALALVEQQATSPDVDPSQVDPQFVEALGSVLKSVLDSPGLNDNAFIARLLSLPSESYIGQQMAVLDVVRVHKARKALKAVIGKEHRKHLERVYDKFHELVPIDFSDEPGRGKREVKNMALDYLMHGDLHEGRTDATSRCTQQFGDARNMTDKLAALTLLAHMPQTQREAVKALDKSLQEWSQDLLLMNKWFRIQATAPLMDRTLTVVKELTKHPQYHAKNPNNIYSLVGGFVMANQYCFHGAPEQSYAFLASQITLLNTVNPQVAARLVKAMEDVVRLPQRNREVAAAQLQTLLDMPGLAKEVYEVASRCHTAAVAGPANRSH